MMNRSGREVVADLARQYQALSKDQRVKLRKILDVIDDILDKPSPSPGGEPEKWTAARS